MRKVWIVLTYSLALLLILAGCTSASSENKVVPSTQKITEWDTSDWPVDTTWTSPPKTWIDDFHPGDSVDFLILLHTPATYSIQKLVTTTTPEEGEDGILLQKLIIPVKDGIGDSIKVASSHPGDILTVDFYNPLTNTVTVSGFEMVKLDRIIFIAYPPDSFTWLVYWKKPNHPDSGRELANPPLPITTQISGNIEANFINVLESARWVKFENGINRATINSDGSTTTRMLVNLTVPENAILPEYWEFWIGAGDITGQAEEQGGVVIDIENVYKILVTSNKFEFLPES